MPSNASGLALSSLDSSVLNQLLARAELMQQGNKVPSAARSGSRGSS